MAGIDREKRTSGLLSLVANSFPSTFGIPGLSAAVLVVVNCIPIVGVIFFGWDVFLILVSYWVENVIVGFYNILRIHWHDSPLKFSSGKIFLIVFFLFHFGGFTYLHGDTILLIFGPEAPVNPGEDLTTSLSAIWPDVMEMLAARRVPLTIMLASLFGSHSISFFGNYLLKGERHRTTFKKLMLRPYRRIVVMHITVGIGGILVQITGSHKAILCVLVVMKIGMDLYGHYHEHKKPAEEQ